MNRCVWFGVCVQDAVLSAANNVAPPGITPQDASNAASEYLQLWVQ
jgi:hypothetical protein